MLLLKRAWFATLPMLLSVVSAFAQGGEVRLTTTVFSDGRGGSIAAVSGRGVPGFDPLHHLVHFKRGAPKKFIPGSGQARAFPGDPDLVLVTAPPGQSIAESVRRYKADPNVEYAEPDYIVQAVATTPNDTLWTQQWDMTRIGATLAWDTQTNASDVVVAIIDSGIDFSHPDLQANLWVNPANSTSHGFTCVGTCTAGGLDDFGHGTHVAGTIGAAGNNALGIAGVNWQVKLLSLKFIGAGGFGQISDAILAFQQVLALKQQGVNIRVTNNSWGGGGFSQALKDAMANVEAAGIVDVCAAGNNFSNSDSTPEYPAAYDNRGIISVLASDATDAGAAFTNFGLANVDIAAPGVDTLSTIPSGTCPLCDATGYRLLSGTSMATPHVAGVVAALLHQRPALSAAEARDIILDPASYDALVDAKARFTSSGGRLNFPKTLANPRLSSAVVLNNFPTVTTGPDVFANPGNFVTLTAIPADPDPGDGPGLRVATGKPVNVGEHWLFGAMINQMFPAPTPGSTSFTAPSLARVATVPYETSVADNRGGGAIGLNYVTVNSSLSPGGAPFGPLAVTNANPAVGEKVTFVNTAIDPEQHPTMWALSAFGLLGGTSNCCFSGVTLDMQFTSAMVFRVKAQTIDPELQLSDDPGVVIRVGGAKGDSPLAKAVLDRLSGPVPLIVNIDMSGSTSPSGAIQSYAFFCDPGGAVNVSSPQGTCTFTTPGPHWLPVMITDVAGQSDMSWSYVVATPASGIADTTPPAVAFAIPSEGATVTGSAVLDATASDPSGVMRVEFRLDSPAGQLLGTSASNPYFINWDTTTVTPGAHMLYAVARDGAGNLGTSAVRNLTVKDTLAPTVTIINPAAGNVFGSVLLTATASDLSGIAEVQYHLDGPAGILLGVSTTGPSYRATWDSSAAPGAHTLYAVARDGAGNIGVSAGVAILVIVRPVVSITSPLNGSLVDAKTNVTIAASLTNTPTFGIARVDFLINGVVTCSDTTAPYSCVWTVRPGANKAYQLQAIGYDSTNAAGPASTVSVISRDAGK